MEIRSAGPELEFRFILQNGMDYKVAEAWYPLVGGLAKFGRGQQAGEASVMLPTASPTIKKMAISVRRNSAALSRWLHRSVEHVLQQRVRREVESVDVFRLPRYDRALEILSLFEESSPEGKDIFACIMHKPFTPKGKSFEGSPVVLRFHDGDWNAAGPIYREWFVKTFGRDEPEGNWIRGHSFFQDTMFILPEGTVNMTFKEIPQWARDARDHGVTAVLISGWHRGGHDNGYPYYEPDPAIGHLRRSEAGVGGMPQDGREGVLLRQLPAGDGRVGLVQERVEKLRGNVGRRRLRRAPASGMGTLWARMRQTKMEAWVDISFPEYRDVLLRHFLKLVEIGADGLHVDKMVPGPSGFQPAL